MKEHDCNGAEPNLEQWAKLYAAAKKIRELSPWQYLWDADLITIMLPGRDEPVFCSVMGRNNECYAVAVYPGFNEVVSLIELIEGEPSLASSLNQDCLTCYFGDREEITPQERQIMKALDLRFRGRNEWIFFRTMDPGYYPWYIDAEQAELLTSALENLALACEYMVREQLQIDFESGETLLRFFSPEQQAWQNSVTQLPPITVKETVLNLGNDIYLARLKKLACNGSRLDFDVTYLPVPIQDDKKERPYFPQLVLFLERESGIMLFQNIANNKDDVTTTALDALAGYIEESGRPQGIYVRDRRAGYYLKDFCRKTGIKLHDNQGVPAVDEFLEGLAEFLE